MPDQKKRDDRDVLFCNPTWMGPPEVPSKLMSCKICGQEVWASPASLIAAGAHSRIVCINCMQAVVDEIPPGEELELMPPTQGQIRESNGKIKWPPDGKENP
jgi:hypothetical protein